MCVAKALFVYKMILFDGFPLYIVLIVFGIISLLFFLNFCLYCDDIGVSGARKVECPKEEKIK